MHQSPRRKIGPFYFVTGQKTSELVGGGLGVSVYISFEGEGIPVIERTMYFEEQTADHIDNFCQKFVYDAHYRQSCLRGTAHWRRVGRLYELNAQILAEERALPEADVFRACRELFHFIRRDLDQIEQHLEYKTEMARQSRSEESAVGTALSLLGQIRALEVAWACQGSKAIRVRECTLFLPSCHTTQATFVFARLPHEFLRYLRTGPLGRLHLATFGEDRIAAALPSRNSAFIQALKEATSAYLRKHGRSTVTERPPYEAENQ
ncbi:MAG: hypothetical protein D4R73_00500 [Deltaproteobacteria bacterium]|nr:MAG: hypothetical protein D4R73_00500 [Deltaproteobacteria bacterium]